MMTLEMWNTVFAGATFLVIAATAVAALIQLRHLRASNQISALVTILQDWQKPEMQGWLKFVHEELPVRLQDPAYLQSITAGPLDRKVHVWSHIGDYYEQLGSFIKYGLVDRQSYLDVSSYTVSGLYELLRPCIERMRAVRNNHALFENFEYLAVLGLQFSRAHPRGVYPPGLPRFNDLEPIRGD
jgi:hypothetical protein